MNVELLAATYAIIAKIEGMKAENMQRQAWGASMAYGDNDFFYQAKELEKIAEKSSLRKAVYENDKNDEGFDVFVHKIDVLHDPDNRSHPCIVLEKMDGTMFWTEFLEKITFKKKD